VSRICKNTFYLQFCMKTPEGHQKSIFNTPKVKKNKDTYRIYPTKFASSTQIHKKVIETANQQIKIKKITNKSMFSTSKVKRRQKFVWGLPDGACRLNPKS
jgi:cellulose biosynthesis protein BcsQ